MSANAISQWVGPTGQNTASADSCANHWRQSDDYEAENRTCAGSGAAGWMHIRCRVSGASRLSFGEAVSCRSGGVHSGRHQSSGPNGRPFAGRVCGVGRVERESPLLEQDARREAVSPFRVRPRVDRSSQMVGIPVNVAVLPDARRITAGVCRTLTAAGGGL